uniref:Uncharacterized protein n=1 Tax=Rhodnius prolixus TaxID=13249 RepID=T1I039_RHOPR
MDWFVHLSPVYEHQTTAFFLSPPPSARHAGYLGVSEFWPLDNLLMKYSKLFRKDTSGALPMVVASVFCLPKLLQWLIISCYCLFAIVGLFKALSASSPWNRRLCFALPFLMRNLLCVLRLTKYGGGDPSSISYVILQDLLSVVGGAIGAVNIPEKWFPGYLDLYLNSHNIMHVLVVSAVYCMFYSATSDLVWMAHGSCDRLISSQYHRDILIKNEL